MNLFNVILMMGGQQGGQQGGGWETLVLLALMIVVFWLFFIRPQTKKAKDEKKYREALKKGDRIITIGGIHGKIIEVEDTAFIIETEGQGRLKIEKNAIAGGAQANVEQKKS